jgi:C4-type Zn-finger protein
MIPIGNNYNDTHPDPTLAQIQYILTMLISRKERFEMVKGIVNGSQAQKITNTPAANKQANRKKTARAKIKKQKRAEQKFSVWIEGMSKQSTLITANTTAQYLIEELFPQCHYAMQGKDVAAQSHSGQ